MDNATGHISIQGVSGKMNKSGHKNGIVAATLGLTVIAAFCIRWIPFKACFAGDRIYFFGADPYYHLRRVLMTAADFWRMPKIDYYLGYPQGTPDMVAPTMYLLVGGLSRVLAGGGHPDAKSIETLSAVVPTVWGAFCVIPVFFLGRQLAGTIAGLVAAASLAVIPAYIFQTLVGCFDNNGLEPLLAAVFFLAWAKALPESASDDGTVDRRMARHWILAGLVGLVALFTWRGSIMFFVFCGFYCLVEVIAASFQHRSPRRILQTAGNTFLTIGALTAPCVAFAILGAQPVLKFNVISWLHVLAYIGSGVLLLVAARIPESWYKSSRAGWTSLLIVAMPTAAILLFVLLRGGRNADISLYNYLFAQNNPWGVQELAGLFRRNDALSLTKPAETLTWGVYAFPLIWLAFTWSEIRKGLQHPRMTLFLVWSLGLMVLTIGRVRFAPLAALGVALALGLLAARVATLPWGNTHQTSTHVMKAAAIGLVIVLLFPAWPTIGSLNKHTYKYPITEDLFSALDWIRDNTPPTSYFEQPWHRPEYGIMAQWDFGHWINYIARRPAVATPMLTETYGLEPQARFFLSGSSDEAERILADNGVRYVIITNVVRYLPQFSRMIGRSPDKYLEEKTDRTGKVVDSVKPQWLSLLSTRLLLNDGLSILEADKDTPPPSHLRLVYESAGNLDVRGRSGDVSRVKVYEYVPGALLRGKTEPFARVTVQIRLLTNKGRIFIWQTSAIAGADGIFALRTPYTTDPAGTVHALSPYMLKTPHGEKVIHVDRPSVEQGKVVSVS